MSNRGSWEADIALELTGLGDPRRPRDRKIDDCSDRRDQSNVPALPARLKLAAGTGRRGERREDFILTASHAGVTGSGTEDQDEEDRLKRTTNSRRRWKDVVRHPVTFPRLWETLMEEPMIDMNIKVHVIDM